MDFPLFGKRICVSRAAGFDDVLPVERTMWRIASTDGEATGGPTRRYGSGATIFTATSNI